MDLLSPTTERPHLGFGNLPASTPEVSFGPTDVIDAETVEYLVGGMNAGVLPAWQPQWDQALATVSNEDFLRVWKLRLDSSPLGLDVAIVVHRAHALLATIQEVVANVRIETPIETLTKAQRATALVNLELWLAQQRARLEAEGQMPAELAEVLTSQSACLSPRQLGWMLGLEVSTINNWRLSGHGPVFAKEGRAILYPVLGVREWLAQKIREA